MDEVDVASCGMREGDKIDRERDEKEIQDPGRKSGLQETENLAQNAGQKEQLFHSKPLPRMDEKEEKTTVNDR